MKCCHGHAIKAIDDPRFEDDVFTQAAVRERCVRAAHAHAVALLIPLVGGFLLLGLIKAIHRRTR